MISGSALIRFMEDCIVETALIYFRKIMVIPFMKILKRHCSSIRMENLHKVLWEVYQESRGERDFLSEIQGIMPLNSIIDFRNLITYNSGIKTIVNW